MSPGPRGEPDAEPGIEELGVTDAFLDRLGRRRLADADADDPLAGMLSLFTAHLDDDPVPVRRTADAVARAETAGSGAAPSGAPLSGVPALRPVPSRPEPRSGADADADSGGPGYVVDRPGSTRPGLYPVPRPAAQDDHGSPSATGRRALRGRDRPVVLPLPLGGPSPRGSARARTVRFNPLAGAAAVLVLVLAASAVSGALTGGASFNPLTGLERVVQRLTGGGDPVPRVTRGQVEARLAVARAALADGDLDQARTVVAEVRRLAGTALAPDDAAAIRAQARRLEQQIDAAQARRTRSTLDGAPAPGTGSPAPPVPAVAIAVG